MTKKMKLLAASAALGAVATMVGAPLLSGACTRVTHYDQDNDNLIVINSPWASNNDQAKALKTVIEEYNKTQKGSDKYVPVTVKFAGKGYDDNDYLQKLQAKNSKDFYNIIINYPTVASTLLSYKMELDLSGIRDDADKIFSPTFLNFNNDIAGNLTSKKLLAIPFTRSSEMAAIDMPLIGKFLTDLQTYGAQLDPASVSELQEYITQYTSNPNQKQEIDKLWDAGKPTADEQAEVRNKLSKYTIKADFLSSYTELVKFADNVKMMYPHNDLRVFGLDSFPNSVYTMMASLNGSTDNSVVKVSSENKLDGGYDYNAITTKGSDQYKRMQQVYELFREGIQAQAIDILGGGAYGSDQLIRHEMAISIGSTAGYSHTFAPDKGTLNIKFKKGAPAKGYISYSYKISEPSASDLKTNPDAILMLENYTLNVNPLFKDDKGIKYSYIIKDENKQSVLDKIAEIKKMDNWQLGAFTSNNNFSYDKSSKKVKYTDSNKNEVTLDKAIYLGKMGSGNRNDDWFYLPPSLVDVSLSGGDQTLQRKEAKYLAAPSKFNSTDENNFYEIQGPSLIGIHANEKEDAGTLKFIDWMISTKLPSIETENSKHKTTTWTNLTPMEVVASAGSYIAPTKTLLDDPVSSAEKLRLNDANKITLNVLTSIQKDPEHNVIVEDVAAPRSQALRSAIQTAGKAAKDKSDNGHELYSFEQFIGSIKRLVRA